MTDTARVSGLTMSPSVSGLLAGGAITGTLGTVAVRSGSSLGTAARWALPFGLLTGVAAGTGNAAARSHDSSFASQLGWGMASGAGLGAAAATLVDARVAAFGTKLLGRPGIIFPVMGALLGASAGALGVVTAPKAR